MSRHYHEDEHNTARERFTEADHRLSKLSGKRARKDEDFSDDDYRNAWYDRKEALAALHEIVSLLPAPPEEYLEHK